MQYSNNHRPIYDLHTHSSFSVDSQTPIQAYCDKAVELGLQSLTITDHVDTTHADMGFGFFRPAEFMAEIDRCRRLYGDRLELLSGVEVSEIHRFRPDVDALLQTYDFDLVIGSLHWIGDVLVDQSSSYFSTRTRDQACEDYFSELRLMCQSGGFDVLGHLDYFKRYFPDPDYDVTRYESLVRPVLAALIQNNIALEINTSPLSKPVKETMPGPIVVQWYRDMGGEMLTVGSDAHSISRLADGWDVALEMVEKANLKHLTLFRRRTPVVIPLESD